MHNRLDILGTHFKDRLGLCHAVSCLENGDAESVRGCLSDVATVLGDVSDTLAVLSDFSSATRFHPGIVGISEGSLDGAVRLMADVIGLCASLSNACGEAIPAKNDWLMRRSMPQSPTGEGSKEGFEA